MNCFHNILAGIDLGRNVESLTGYLSPPNLEAVERALALAEQSQAKLSFVSVLDAGDTTRRLVHDVKADTLNVFDEAHALLSQLVQRAAQRGVSAEARVVMGKSWLKLIQEVLKHQHDLVIVGTRHEGMVDRVLFGSTAMKLLRKCPCPVWVTKPSNGLPLSSVLVAHDLDAVGRHALDLGIMLTRAFDLKLHVIHALEQLPIGDPTGFGITPPGAEAMHAEAHEKLLVELAGADLRRTPEIRVISGFPEPAIADMLREESIDLLIMGTLGRAGIRGVITGNTAERLLPRLQCSMLAIKPDGFECPVDPE
ncbi:MAG: universal stress protein [Planctomycetaceae bacterium]|nr:universal stress protein [Planctomycetaceae bacterium]